MGEWSERVSERSKPIETNLRKPKEDQLFSKMGGITPLFSTSSLEYLFLSVTPPS
jgi:hypothetical protein